MNHTLSTLYSFSSSHAFSLYILNAPLIQLFVYSLTAHFHEPLYRSTQKKRVLQYESQDSSLDGVHLLLQEDMHLMSLDHHIIQIKQSISLQIH
ncbi:unnamed protein product [Lactuca virosa]|uniref:Uncharacterized protein n=1 Tax=Lactuca virosa TaxID=75947 RepID=A0AAU9MHJ3_9ASTR|nr:unnamed protein product [Lactuca virosa]